MPGTIMITVDLAHEEGHEKAFAMAAALAREHGSDVTVVGVTPTTPTSVAASPEAYGEKLGAYAAREGERFGVPAKSHMMVSHDPAADLDDKLQEAVKAVGPDLVVMLTHQPGIEDHLFAGHATHMASHAPCSVLVVR